jgi:CRISPR-associated exonuclease Cas4/CRISPR-associated protein Cas1
MSHHDRQLRLPLPAPPRGSDQPLVPVRMVNEWVYCPRLAWLMWVDGEWADTTDTAAGRRAHARADAGGGTLPLAGEMEQDEDLAAKARAVTLASERLGLIAKMDVIEAEDGQVTPVDIKKGKRPHVDRGAYEPERVQVCLQALILEDNGYRVAGAALWYAGSRERVRVELDEELRAKSLQAASDLRLALAAGKRPPPLANSPKCVRCALAGICLPDEIRWFSRRNPPRPLNPADDPAMPLHVVTPGARIGKKGDTLVITTPDGEKTQTPLMSVSDASLFGPVSVSTPALDALMKQGSSIAWFSTGGWFYGLATNASLRAAHVREAQYRASFDDLKRLAISRALVEAKIRNQRTMLRRNWRKGEDKEARKEALTRLKRLYERAPHARSIQQLLGVEGEAAAIYFASFPAMLKSDADGAMPFDFTTRNRRPPRDPVNAMLSFAYAILARQLTAILTVTGFDPWRGFYHALRPGRPSLALDMMEPYRPIIADSAVITAINNGEVTPDGFVSNGPACAMKTSARKAFLKAYERRMEQETTHPAFGYQVSMRRLLEVQMRLFSRYLEGEIKTFPHYLPR